MAAVLGLSAHFHDAAAALVVDGEIVAAIQEERLSRIKHDASLPVRAARACLAQAGIDARALDAVVFYENPFGKLERVLLSLVRAFPRGRGQFVNALASQLGSKIWIVDEIAERIGVGRNKVHLGDHHTSHAASAYYTSPYAHAAVLTVDGVGERTTTALWHGRESALSLVESIDYPHSLGLFYAAFTAWLGFAVNEGEYKVMGLAAFGAPRHDTEVARTLRLDADGSFTLDLDYFAHTHDAELGFSPALERLFGARRDPRRPWDPTGEDRKYADVAASVQRRLEEALLGLARRARARTGEDALCLAGGVALNAVANARIAAEAGFARVYVQPAAGDAGGALGAALMHARSLGDPRCAPLRDCALGLVADGGEALALAASLGYDARRIDDVAGVAADALVRGDVVAWVQGRFEWGPRALGQRSLLALPAEAATRERLNRLVKEREPFRPFAPATLESHAARWFEHTPNDRTPFMTTVERARKEAVERFPAAVHVDGTARLQTVAEDGALAPLLHALEQRDVAPVVVNTSLNAAAEPIVAGAIDALALFARRPIDLLLVEDVEIRRRS
ncbi:MAG: carbamoyltransferase N-terminal domain-containing protein [Polyangia bacterium]